MSDAQLPKEKQVECVSPGELTLDSIRKNHAAFNHSWATNGGYKGYETQCIDVLITRIDELERDVARYENCRVVLLAERDRYKQQAEINAETIRNMQEHKSHAIGEEPMSNEQAPSNASLERALEDIESLCDYAYDEGFEELGYDPLKMVKDEIERLLRENAALLRNRDALEAELRKFVAHSIGPRANPEPLAKHPDCRCNPDYECDRCANIRINNRIAKSTYQPPGRDDARDAARYRLLRSGNDYEQKGPMVVLCEQEHIESDDRPFWSMAESALDEAIDTALAESRPTKGAGHAKD